MVPNARLILLVAVLNCSSLSWSFHLSANRGYCRKTRHSHKTDFSQPSNAWRTPLYGSSGADGGPEDKERGLQLANTNDGSPKRFLYLKRLVQGLASLSLADYTWRKDIFVKARASQHESSALTRLTGDTQKIKPMMRPMDLSPDLEDLGPLGIAESKAVSWLEEVFDSEAQRARQIVEDDDQSRVSIRPSEAAPGTPLAEAERGAIEFYESLVRSEKARGDLVRHKGADENEFGVFLPPSELPDETIGPLGKAERALKQAISSIKDAEILRLQLSKSGDNPRLVRPLDVGGPMGEAERFMSDIQMAEKKRVALKEKVGTVVRPMDAAVKGPLGETEEKVVDLAQRIAIEEKKRLDNLVENRPMNTDRDSIPGRAETVSVGILRAPMMFYKVFERVGQLLRSGDSASSDTMVIPPGDDDDGGEEEEQSLLTEEV